MRIAAIALTLTAAVALASCSAGADEPTDEGRAPEGVVDEAPVPSESPPPSGEIGQPFTNGAFEMTVTAVKLGVQSVPLDDIAASGGLQPWTPENGQFIVVYMTAKNIGKEPLSAGIDSSALFDAADNEYSGQCLSTTREAQELGAGAESQQPGTTRKGFIVFDVPAEVKAVTSILVQTDPAAGTENLPTLVGLES